MSTQSRRPTSLAMLYERLRSGELNRRAFFQQAVAMGMTLPVALHAVHSVSAQTPETGPPAIGTEGKGRGEGGELRILQWQAPTILAQHSSLGGKDNLAATFILEPLTHYLPDGTLIPNLVATVPTVDNGMLAADNSSVTYTLKSGITWSNGTPLTAEDIRFTWAWITDSANGASSFDIYDVIADVEVVDDLTATLIFGAPQPAGGGQTPQDQAWVRAAAPALGRRARFRLDGPLPALDPGL